MPEIVLVINDNDYHSQIGVGAIESGLGYRVQRARGMEEALSKIVQDHSAQADLVLIDMALADTDGLKMLQLIRACRPGLPVILVAEQNDDQTMQKAAALGVSDVLARPLSVQRLRMSVSNIAASQRMGNYIAYLERKAQGRVTFSDIIGDSPVMRDVVAKAKYAASDTAPVWISGEAGTGKELLAAAIHGSSSRAGGPFLALDCAGLGDTAQQKLWGNESGHGLIAQAAGGTLLLKNVCMLESDLVQQLRTQMQQGASAVRFILTGESYVLSIAGEGTAVADPQFKDLCNTVIALPPLRERLQDIPALARHALRMYCASENKKICNITEDALLYFEESSWPGNVRELNHLIWRAVLLARQDTIDAGCLRHLRQYQPLHYSGNSNARASGLNPLLADMNGRLRNLEAIEKEVIQFALAYAGGCMTHAAKNLGIGRSTLYRRMHALQLEHYISRENQTTRPTIRISSKAHS